MAAAAALLGACIAPAQAQTIGDGIVTSAAKTVFIAPTHGLVVALVSPLAEVLTKVQALDFRIEDLRQVHTQPGFDSPLPGVTSIPSRTIYNFVREVPLARLGQELDRIRQFASQNTDLPTAAQLGGIKASDEAVKQTHQQAFQELYREAKARAEAMAREAGLTPGRVLGVTDAFGAAFSLYPGNLTTFQLPASVTVRLAIE